MTRVLRKGRKFGPRDRDTQKEGNVETQGECPLLGREFWLKCLPAMWETPV